MKTIPLFKVYMSEEAAQKAKDVLMSGYIGQGPIVDEFEKKLKGIFDNDFVVSTNSATSAEHLAVHLLKEPVDKWPGIQEGDEALATALTCTATNWPLLANGLKIKWVDVDPNNLNMDLDDLARKITNKTKVMMVVHWGGYPVDLDRLKVIQQQAKEIHGFAPAIIEDSAHSFGSKYKNKPIGSHGNINTFSFQAIKHLTCGDGGALVLPHERLYQRAKLLRWFGINRENNSKDFRCLHPDTLIIKENGVSVKIKDVVKNKDVGPVLCIDNGKYTYKNITGWHNSDIGERKLVKITTEKLKGYKTSVVTDDHEILTINGYKRVNELRDGELVATSDPEIYYDKLIIEEYNGTKSNTVYCIDVEDAHNFASSSIIVHNCEADVREWGYKFHMNDINAQIGLSNLNSVFENVIQKHKDNADYFNTVLKDVDGVTLLENKSDRVSSSWIYTILVDRQSDFMNLMKAHGIMCSRVHERNDIHTCVKDYKSILPSLDKVIKHMMCIPAGWWVTSEDREYIYNTIKKGW